MGTTIEDIYAEQALEEEYKKLEEQEIIAKFKAQGIQIEEALQIFDFLPIRGNVVENGYIKYLWDAFLTLDSFSVEGRAFLLMPFHLLFMLALQYKGLRIAKVFPEAVDLFFAGVGGRNKDKLLNPQRAVYDLAFINERTLPELLRLVGLTEENIQKTKSLIDDRNNNLAHAKGGIASDPNKSTVQYLSALRTLQPCLVPHNDRIAEQWLSEISDEDDLSEYVDLRLSDSQLCPADFKAGMLSAFSLDEDAPLEEWQAAVSEVLTSGSRPGLLWLQHIARNHPDSGWRFNVIQMLDRAGKLDEELKTVLLQNEKDPETIALLNAG